MSDQLTKDQRDVHGFWLGTGDQAVLWWNINGEEISDRDLRSWCFHNMGESNPWRYVTDVVRKCHTDAYANRSRS